MRDLGPEELLFTDRTGARAVLGAYNRVFVGRAVATVLDLDPALAARVRDQVGPAVERALGALRGTPAGGAPAFDLRTQTASLIGALAAIDDDHAASAAEALLVQVGRWTPAVNEVASALGHGTGPATFAVLERLAEHGVPSVRALARESLGRRRAAVVANLAERMCAARTTSEADLIDALGVTLDAPPLGGTAARVRGGDIPTFEVDLPEGTLTRADLDARLGEPRRLPQTGRPRLDPAVVQRGRARRRVRLQCVRALRGGAPAGEPGHERAPPPRSGPAGDDLTVRPTAQDTSALPAMPAGGPATSSGQWPRHAESTGRTPPGR